MGYQLVPEGLRFRFRAGPQLWVLKLIVFQNRVPRLARENLLARLAHLGQSGLPKQRAHKLKTASTSPQAVYQRSLLRPQKYVKQWPLWLLGLLFYILLGVSVRFTGFTPRLKTAQKTFTVWSLGPEASKCKSLEPYG